MNRDEFYHLLRASSTIIENVRAERGIDVEHHPARLLVLGSQSILGSWHEDYLPKETTYSTEMDLAVLPDEYDEMCFDDPAQEFADYIDGNIGEGSHFQDAFDVYAQGVEEATAVLPDGWKNRLIEVQGRNMGIVSTVLCLDPYDLCAAKLARLEEKDRRYISALVDNGDINLDVLRHRLDQIHDIRMTVALRSQASDFLNALEHPELIATIDAATSEVKSKDKNSTLSDIKEKAMRRIQHTENAEPSDVMKWRRSH